MPNAVLTPLYETRHDTFLKCEFLHPGRSHKARVAQALVDDAERRGEIGPNRRRTLLERTGGNLGIALAMEASIRDYKLTLVTDPHYSQRKKEIAARLGAQVIDRGVLYPHCNNNQEVIDELLANSDHGFHYLNQFGNPVNPKAHERGTGAEILSQLISNGHGQDTTVVLVKGLGTGASMRGISSALRTWFGNVVTLGVQPPNCDILADEYGQHIFQGIAVGQPPPFFSPRELDGVIQVSESQAMDGGEELRRQHRFFVGPSSAANYAALVHAREHPMVKRHERCVFVTVLYDRWEDYE